MGKKDKAHRAKVAKRNLRQEQEAWNDWEKIEGVLKKNGFKSVEEAIEKAPELTPILLPYALRALKTTTTNLKKYGDEPV